MADTELDELYSARPQEFTALRGTLAAAAKKRGDTATAKAIATARKPTTAAWVVNHLVRVDPEARDRLRDLSDQLRAAHAEMDGERIRALSAEQRLLVDHLTRAAFTAVDLENPSAALRDAVTSTLQAAIADPDVAARLGTLVQAERWSGFGFGESTVVPTTARKTAPASPPKTESAPAQVPDDAAEDRRRALEETRKVMAKARQAKAASDETLLSRRQELAAAKSRHQAAQRALRDAERLLEQAEAAYAAAERAGMDVTARIAMLRARLDELRA